MTNGNVDELFGPRECWCTQHGQVWYPCNRSKLCKETKDTQICGLSRKCTRRNKQKRKFTAKKWVKWSDSHYGKC